MNLIPEKKITGNQNIAFVLRHAERFPIEDMKTAFEAQLTEKGKADAYNFGINLASIKYCNSLHNTKLYHSPIERCRQTAEYIVRGLDNKNYNPIMSGELHALGGCYIKGNWFDVASEINNTGYSEYLQLWIDGKLSDDLLYSIEEAAYIIVNNLVKKLIEHNTSTINVTHDWNILLLREYFFNIKHEDNDMPGYLDCIALFIKENRLYLYYHNCERIIDINSDNQLLPQSDTLSFNNSTA